MSHRYLIYGANGYTGELISRLAAKRGHTPVLAGRDPVRIPELAGELGFEHEVFKLETQPIVENRLEGYDLVLHCAGPFLHTYRTVSKACVATGTHYLDITGEAAVFESLARTDQAAEEAGIVLMPGVGFDVVPTDCLALHLKERLPEAEHLVLAIRALGRLSRGTTLTMIENIHRGGLIRKDGKLTAVPAAWKERDFDFGRGPRPTVTMPWGDVASAYYTTGIPNIEVFMSIPGSRKMGLKLSRYLAPVLGSRPIQALMKGRIRNKVTGPSDKQREAGGSVILGEVSTADGRVAKARLETPEGYSLTAMTALAAVERILEAEEPPLGFKTPAGAFGSEFILGIEGVTLTDLD